LLRSFWKIYFKFSAMFSINLVSIQNYSNITISSSKWSPLTPTSAKTTKISSHTINMKPEHAFTMSPYGDED